MISRFFSKLVDENENVSTNKNLGSLEILAIKNIRSKIATQNEAIYYVLSSLIKSFYTWGICGILTITIDV